MEGYYTRKEAANILGVSARAVSKYIKDGLLRNVGTPKNILVPCDCIHHFYENNQHLSVVSRMDFLTMEKKLSALKAEMEVLKMVMGIGSHKPARTDAQLLSLFSDIMRLLSSQSWSSTEIFTIADLMISIKDTEVARLLHLKGTRAWNGMFDLAGRMCDFLDDNPDIPREASTMMQSRIDAGKNRLYGLLFVSTQSSVGLDKIWTQRLLARRGKSGTIDEFVISYLHARK